MTSAIKWCCVGFEAAYQAAGERSIAVIVDEDQGEPEFFLQSRAVDAGDEQKIDAVVPISLVIENGIQFCPWCGRSLHKWYGTRATELRRPDLRIERPSHYGSHG
jgi:hypothetical protein